MRDIVVNPDAVYGFSPSGAEESTLKEYVDAIDWTNWDQVEKARAQRQEYHDSLQELYEMIMTMVEEDLDVETIARAVSQRRNEIRMESYTDDPEGLELVKKRNLEVYGNENGPTPEFLFEKYGSWEMVLIKALGTNPGMDACLGFYDEYYDLYDLETESSAESQIADRGNIYTLDRVVILSRHNIRSPLSGSGSLLGDITPHEWFHWTSNPSELSLRGGVLETMMGQYFRLWLEKEGLFPENYQPEEGAVRFYANAKQRTLATARYFSAGLLPVAEVPVEYHGAYDTMDPTFEPSLNFVTEDYAQDALADIAGEGGFDSILESLDDAISLLIDTADIEQSETYQAGKYGNLLSGETLLTLTEGKEPSMTGPIKNATSVADAMILQYYEEADAKKAAFGHDITEDDWRLIHSIVDTYTEMLFCSPLISVNVAHPLIREIRDELTEEGRKFTFLCGHDANIASVLAALNYGDYLLPETVEQHTPIGVKLVFERWLTNENEAYYKINLVYQSTQQLRSMEQLTLENPPVIYPLHFDGMNAEGMMEEAELLALLDGAINAYEELLEEYTTAENEAA
jgi:glucose-1-phosphatase